MPRRSVKPQPEQLNNTSSKMKLYERIQCPNGCSDRKIMISLDGCSNQICNVCNIHLLKNGMTYQSNYTQEGKYYQGD